MAGQAYTESLARRMPYEMIHRLSFSDGRIKHVHMRSSSTYADDGAALQSAGTIQDITECMLKEEQLKKTAADLIRPDGEERWVEVSFECEFDPQDHPLLFFGILQDINQRKQSEAAPASALFYRAAWQPRRRKVVTSPGQLYRRVQDSASWWSMTSLPWQRSSRKWENSTVIER